MVDGFTDDGVVVGLADDVFWFDSLMVVFVGWLVVVDAVVACDCPGLFDDGIIVGFVVDNLVAVGFIVDVGFVVAVAAVVDFVVFSVAGVLWVVVNLLISVVVRDLIWVVLVTLGTVETISNDCAVVFWVNGSDTVVVLLDGFIVDGTVEVAGVVNVVSKSQYKKAEERNWQLAWISNR